MAHIQRRGPGNYRARYTDPSGKERQKKFTRKLDAQRWLDEQTTSMITGQYVNPKAGRITFGEYAKQWQTAQVHRPSTQASIASVLKNHILPTFGHVPIGDILPSQVQAWVKGREGVLAAATISVAHSYFYSIMKSAVRDRRIIANPCEGTRLPKAPKKRVIPLTTEQVTALRDEMPDHATALVTVAAGTGMRQGELFGLTVDRVDFLRRKLTVDRQLVGRKDGEPVFGPPKTESSERDIPLPKVVVDTLAEHLAVYPAASDEVIFRNELGNPHGRTSFGDSLWNPAVKRAGLPRRTGMHALRHYYASLLIHHGESVKTVQERLGHASASETLNVYSHLWPNSDDRTREAIDAVLGTPAEEERAAQ